MDVAIVGMAGRFPGARNIEELFQNLKDGIDSVRPISKDRLKNTALPLDKKYRPCGYLEGIDKFDNKMFGVSNSESVNMCPSQRLLLETAYQVFESAGYNVDEFNDSNTSVYTADSGEYHYYRHADQFNITLMTGNSQEFASARIARHFNLRGNAMAINSACSSSIVAIHMACNDLTLGDADSVLVCSVNLDFFPFDQVSTEVKLASSDGKSRAFSEQADGMSFGETACGVLLKPLEKAIEDNDIIHAVIKGSAVNNNGNSSTSILAPSSVRQAEVIKKAWQKADVRPHDLGFIEAHGSGTQIGDCLEAEGLATAIRMSQATDRHIPISTIKSNLGHCMLASGMVGLIKTVLSLKNGMLFPNLHCEELNSKIDFEKAGISVSTRLREWPTLCEDKYAGLSSLGRSGVNSHIVLKNYVKNQRTIGGEKRYLFTVSSKHEEGLKANVQDLLQFLKKNNDINLKDLSYTLNHGRKHYEHRVSCVATSISDMSSQFQQSLENKHTKRKSKMYIVLNDQTEITSESVKNILEQYPDIFKGLSHNLDLDSFGVRSFIYQLSMYRLLCLRGIEIMNFISFGVGKLVKDVILDNISLQKGIELASKSELEDVIDLDVKVQDFMQREGDVSLTLIDLGLASNITQTFKSLYSKNINGVSTKLTNEPLLDILSGLYQDNIDINWAYVFNQQKGQRIELPSYNFKKTRFWLRDEPSPVFTGENQDAVSKSLQIIDKANELETIVAHVFADVLALQEISIDASFFELGGDSLKATKVITQINSNLKVKLDFEDIFDFPSVRELCTYLFEQTDTEDVLISIWKLIFKTDHINVNDNFFELGGHSLIATQIINRVKGILNVELNFEDIFRNAELGQLAKFIDEQVKSDQRKSKGNLSQIPRAEKKEVYPVSYAQRRIVLLEKFYGLGSSYNMPGAFTIEGDFNIDQMKIAFRELIKRHESFRTSFFYEGTTIKQKVLQNLTVPMTYHDLTTEELSANELDQKIRSLISESIQPFDLSTPPFLRVLLIKTEEKKWVLMYDINHIVVDRHSYNLITHDFMALYGNHELDELSIQYKDYAVWQHHYFLSEQFLTKEKYWLSMFEKPVQELNLPTDFDRPVKRNSDAEVYQFSLTKELTEKVKHSAKQHNVTLYVFLLTAFKVMVHRLTNQDDIRIGSPFSERSNQALRNVAGILLNTIVFRSYPNKKKTFNQYLSEVMDMSVQAFKNGDYQFEMLLDKIGHKRVSNRNPLFDILFNSQTTAVRETKETISMPNKELSIKPYEMTKFKSSNFDMSVLVDDLGEVIHYTVTYQTSLFRESTISYYMEQYQKLLKQVADSPSKKLDEYTVFDKKVKARKRIKVTSTI